MTITRRLPRILSCLILSLSICAGSLPAQNAPDAPVKSSDPTANSLPPAAFKIEPVGEQAKFSIAAPLLLGTGLLSTLAGTILCLYSGSLKVDYDTAYNAWNSNKNDTTQAARDSAAAKFFTPLLIGAGLDIIGIVLVIGGFDQGDGIKNLTPVPPVETTPAP